MGWYYSVGERPVGPVSADDIESLFVTGQISETTLVWQKGMAQWAQLPAAPEFAKLQDLPPPLPPNLTNASAIEQGIRDEVLLVGPEVGEEPNVQPELRIDQIMLFAQPKLAGPWTRYFARALDLSVISTAIMAAVFLVLPSVSPALYLQAYAADARMLFLLTLPFAHIVNAIIITLFGNSLGKAVFAIKAVPIDGREKFTFWETLGREFRVYTEGLALGLPIVNLFTMVPAYRRVNRGQPAIYDLRKATVRSFSDGKIRRTIGMLIAAVVLLGVAFSNAFDKMALENLSQPVAWRNPVTQTTTTIPGNWQQEVVPGQDSATLYGFANLTTGIAAVFAVETAANLDLPTYAQALKSALVPTMSLGNWSMSSIPGVWKVSGTLSPEGFPSTIYVTQVGSSFWRIVYIDQINRGPREIVEPQMTNALLKSAGVSGVN